MSKYCGKCGHGHKPNAKFCGSCGAPLNVQIKMPASNSNEAKPIHQPSDSANRKKTSVESSPKDTDNKSEASFTDSAKDITNQSKTSAKQSLEETVIAFQQGDIAAYERIYSEMYRTVFVAAKVLVKSEFDADDITQEVFIQVYSKIGTLYDPGTFKSWLLTITRNTALNKLKKASKSEITVDEGAEHVFESVQELSADSLPEISAMGKAKSQIILDLVSFLPYEQKEAVLMRYINQRSVAEIAAMTNTSQGTVKSRLNYARQKLKDLVIAEEQRSGVKLYSRGLFLFLPIALRFFARTLPLSAESAAAALEGVIASTEIGLTLAAESALPTGATAGVTSTATSAVAVGNTAGVAISSAGTTTTVVAAALVCAVGAAGLGIGIGVVPSVNEPVASSEIIAVNVSVSDWGSHTVFYNIEDGEQPIDLRESFQSRIDDIIYRLESAYGIEFINGNRFYGFAEHYYYFVEPDDIELKIYSNSGLGGAIIEYRFYSPSSDIEIIQSNIVDFIEAVTASELTNTEKHTLEDAIINNPHHALDSGEFWTIGSFNVWVNGLYVQIAYGNRMAGQ